MGDNNNPFVLVKFSHEGNVYLYIALRHEVKSSVNNGIDFFNDDDDDDIITINRQPPTDDDDTFVVVNNTPPPPAPGAGGNRIRIIPLYLGQDMYVKNNGTQLRAHADNKDNNNPLSLGQDNGPNAAAAAKIMAALASKDPVVVTGGLSDKQANEIYEIYEILKAKAAALHDEKGGRRRSSSARKSSAKKRASRRKPRSTKKRASRRYRRRRA